MKPNKKSQEKCINKRRRETASETRESIVKRKFSFFCAKILLRSPQMQSFNQKDSGEEENITGVDSANEFIASRVNRDVWKQIHLNYDAFTVSDGPVPGWLHVLYHSSIKRFDVSKVLFIYEK